MRGGVEPEVSGFRPASVDAQVRVVREAAGERFGRLELSALIQRVIVTDDRHAAVAELTQRWPQLRADDFLETPYLLIGTVGRMAEQVQRWRERWGFSYLVTHEAYADAFAPVVARLAGH
jgi:hypothetical protein